MRGKFREFFGRALESSEEKQKQEREQAKGFLKGLLEKCLKAELSSFVVVPSGRYFVASGKDKEGQQVEITLPTYSGGDFKISASLFNAQGLTKEEQQGQASQPETVVNQINVVFDTEKEKDVHELVSANTTIPYLKFLTTYQAILDRNWCRDFYKRLYSKLSVDLQTLQLLLEFDGEKTSWFKNQEAKQKRFTLIEAARKYIQQLMERQENKVILSDISEPQLKEFILELFKESKETKFIQWRESKE